MDVRLDARRGNDDDAKGRDDDDQTRSPRQPGNDRTARSGKQNADHEIQIRRPPANWKASKIPSNTCGNTNTTRTGPHRRNRSLTDKRTWEYNEDSQETATVSPRGNVTGGKPAEFTTKTERDSQGRPLKITDPLAHTTKYTYDGDGNVETVTDGNSHTTKYTYNADNQPIKVEAPNKAITETEYDGAGQVISQTDGNKHTTKYIRNARRGGHRSHRPARPKTKKEYDAAGNLTKLERPRQTHHDLQIRPGQPAHRSQLLDGKPATVKYEYDKDGDRTKMTDGTGTTKYTYDQLDRLTESENGHKEVSKYEYDLANEQTKITYPNTKSVTRAFDKAGRLEKVTDWSANVTKFTYNPDSQPATTLFPTRNHKRRQIRLQRRGPDDRSQDAQRRRNARLARLHPRQRRPGQKDHLQRAARRRNHGKHLRRKQSPHQIRHANTNTTPRTTRRRSAPAPTNTTKPTSSKQAPA